MRRYLLAALLLALLVMPVLRTQAISDHVWLDDLSTGTREFLVGTGTVTLGADALAAPEYMGSFARSGSYLSPPYTYSHAVVSVILDTDASLPLGADVRLDVRGQIGDSWQLWQPAPRGQRVTFDWPTSVVQFRLTLLTNAESPRVRSVSVTADWSNAGVSTLSQPVAPTYRIYATREGLVGRRTANGHVIAPRDHFVALPSWRSLSSRGGSEYKVRLSYKGRSVVVPVWDVGPWNTHDDYWSTNRQMWKDLPRGKPEAQAAYQNGYNGGRDEFGRKPNLPNGIDIADGTFWDSLGMKDWDWVDVTFLWEGSDPGGGQAAAPPTESAPAAGPPVPAAPPPDGALVLDNTQDAFDEVSGTWFDGACGVSDTHRWTYTVPSPAQVENVGVWRAPVTAAGLYELFAYVPACGKPATHAAVYNIVHNGNTTNVTLDQEAHQNIWSSLGRYYFQPGDPVTLTDLTGEKSLSLRYDALAWVPRSDTVPPNAVINSIRDLGDGRYSLGWQGTDDSSGVASFDLQVQRNGGEWQDWLVGTAKLSELFLVDATTPTIYGFRVRARDWAGNTGDYPVIGQQATSFNSP
jgi:hypothetical protein